MATGFTTRELTRRDWSVIEALFGANGACGGCWCMWWRMPMGGKTWAAANGAPNRTAPPVPCPFRGPQEAVPPAMLAAVQHPAQ